MILLIGFAFLAGIVTILSPCILPVLPIILASSVSAKGSDRSRPVGIVLGFVASFTFFTLFLSAIVRASGIPSDALRQGAIVIVAVFGVSLLIPRIQLVFEQLFARLSNLLPQTQARPGFAGGILVGLSLGLLWTPCVGPILASVIALAATGSVTFDAFLITLAYSLGTAIPMFAIILGGQRIVQKSPLLLSHTGHIQKVFGLVMIALALALYAGFDRTFQTYVLKTFPQYGTGLTKIEDTAVVKTQLMEMNKPAINLMKKGIKSPELILGGQWFNLPAQAGSEPRTLESMRGKVVLVDFWTYTCINCIRTIPYINAWHEKYQDKGLVIIGVHSPEFEFEKDRDNVASAIADFGIKYPVMQDNDFATWQAYSNRYWPAKYLIDKDGYVRYTHFGEGDYDETEAAIQELLIEAGQQVEMDIDNTQAGKNYSRTPELYLGSARYDPLAPLVWSDGWKRSEEYSLAGPGASLTLKYNAKDVYLVMKPTKGKADVQVWQGGKLIKTIDVEDNTLYTLIKGDAPQKNELRLVFPDGNVELYAFTFG